jgi:hypothetical protein
MRIYFLYILAVWGGCFLGVAIPDMHISHFFVNKHGCKLFGECCFVAVIVKTNKSGGIYKPEENV